jgi:hypothetical protein
VVQTTRFAYALGTLPGRVRWDPSDKRLVCVKPNPQFAPLFRMGEMEADGTLAVTEINIWKDCENRDAGIAGVGQHGQQVKLIRRSGDGVKTELPGGAQGWVT